MESAAAGSLEAAVIVALQNFANNNSFDTDEGDTFKHAREKGDLCALYNYGVSLFVKNSSSKEDLDEIVACFRCVAEQHGDGSELSYETFLKKGIGFNSCDRWRIVLLECEWGLPESQFLYGKHLYSIGKIDEALNYFKQAAKKMHAEAMFAAGAVLIKDRGRCVSEPEVKGYFEQAAKDGILEAQYNYGLGLLAESTEIRDLRHGAEVLSWAAKEILLRRQCKVVHVDYGKEVCEFLYSPLPHLLTKRATDNYIWDHISENLAKIYRMSWYEILHPVTPKMSPQKVITSSGLR